MKIKYFVAGMISLIVFGLLLPQPIQALFVYTSLKSFFDSHLVLLSYLVLQMRQLPELRSVLLQGQFQKFFSSCFPLFLS